MHKECIASKGYILKQRYGITKETYQEMLQDQLHCCAICGVGQWDVAKNFAVDHDHSSGKVRGLLCSNCNTGLGQFKDDKELLKKAINYLEQHD